MKVKITKIKREEEVIDFEGTLDELHKAIKMMNRICKEEYRFNVL